MFYISFQNKQLFTETELIYNVLLVSGVQKSQLSLKEKDERKSVLY